MDKHYTIEDVFQMIGKEHLTGQTEIGRKYNQDKNILVDGYVVRRDSLRYMTFYQKGTTCVSCDRQGAYFKLETNDASLHTNRRHFNLYSQDGILMTKDHIVPKSKGGKNHIDNMQTMCALCNAKKANQ